MEHTHAGRLVRALRLSLWTGTAAAVLALGLPMAGSPTAHPGRADVARWVQQLGDPHFRVREEASERLWRAGQLAETALQQAERSGDPEVAQRARAILERFRYGLYPDTPPELAQWVHQFRAGQSAPDQPNASQRQIEALQHLYDAGPPGRAVLRKLAWAAPDTDWTRRIFERVASHAVQTAEELAATGDPAIIGELLETGVACMAEPAMRDLAAYHLLRGSLDEAIKPLRERADEGDRRADEPLVYLDRARGDLRAARQAAERSGKSALLEGVLAEQGDWKALAEAVSHQTVRNRGRTGAVPSPGLKAFCHELAGNSAAAEAELREALREPPLTGSTALFFLGRPQDALAGLMRDGRYAEVVELLSYQSKAREALGLAEAILAGDRHGRWAQQTLGQLGPYVEGIFGRGSVERSYRQIMDLARTARTLTPQERRALQLQRAQTLYQMGRTEQAREAFNQLARQPTDPPFAAALIEAECELGLKSQALLQADRFLAGPAGRNPAPILTALFGDSKDTAQVWWQFSRRTFPGESPLDSVQRIRRLLEWGPEASHEFDRLAPQLEREALARPDDQEAWLRALGETARVRNQRDLARQYFEKGGKAPGAAHLSLMRLGDVLAEEKRWAEAAGAYARAWEKDRSRPASLYLRGWALRQAGRVKEGEEAMARAHWVPLGNALTRYELAETLSEHGLTDSIRREYELLLRTTTLERSERAMAANVLNRLMAEAATRKDYLRAAEHGERVLLTVLQTGVSFSHSRSRLSLPAAVHRYRARGLASAGRIDEARREIQRTLELLPGDIDLPILLVPELERHGQSADAEALFSRVYDVYARLCADYPQSASSHNALAWLAARCRRRLPEASKHAHRAVELMPDRAGFLDTAAEVDFQAGRRDEAILAMKRCIRMEPKNDYFRKQLKRFEAGDRDADVPDE